LKPLVSLVDETPVVPAELLSFLEALASYYLAPIGEVLRLALPALERERVREMEQQGELLATDPTKQVGGKRSAFAAPTDAIEALGTLRGQAAMILALLRANGDQPVTRLAEKFGGARAAVKKLEELGLVTTSMRERPRDPFFSRAAPRDVPPDLN